MSLYNKTISLLKKKIKKVITSKKYTNYKLYKIVKKHRLNTNKNSNDDNYIKKQIKKFKVNH